MLKSAGNAMVAALALLGVFLAEARADGAPELDELTLGLPVTSSNFLPIYLAEEEGFFEAEGVRVETIAFRGGTDLVRALIAEAVEIGITSLAGLTVGIAAEQPIKGFYAGINQANFDWYAVEGIESFADLRGKRIGVSRFGSSTDFLTRYALKAHGVDPESEATIVQGGRSTARLAAMEAGQLDVNILVPPEKFIAADRGYNLILRQKDLTEDFPFGIMFATEAFLRSHPNTIRAVLRGYLRGLQLAKADRARSIRLLVERVGVDPAYAERTYDDFIGFIHEDGRMASADGMDAFWRMGVDAGLYDAPWPEERYLIRDWIDSYESWRP